MVRGKIEMKRIENTYNRQVSFTKRSQGLMKKAKELSVLCDVEVAVIIYSHIGKLYEFASPRMDSILAKYNNVPESSEQTIDDVAIKVDEPQPKGEYALKVELAMLRRLKTRLMGGIEGLTSTDIQLLEHRLTEVLLTVKDLKEKKTMLKNKLLRKQVKELKHALALKKKS